jgi:hypothetical protein
MPQVGRAQIDPWIRRRHVQEEPDLDRGLDPRVGALRALDQRDDRRAEGDRVHHEADPRGRHVDVEDAPDVAHHRFCGSHEKAHSVPDHEQDQSERADGQIPSHGPL